MLGSKEHKRYKRHIALDAIGEKGQTRLKHAQVLVVGAGGLGCPALQYLAAAGVGKLGIVDPDLVDMTNLHRQILYSDLDIGKNKAEVAADKLMLLNPLVNIVAYPIRFEDEVSLKIAEGYDLIVDGTDNFEARYCINDTSKQLMIPMVYGAIYKFEGQISVFNYQGGPDYRSFFDQSDAQAPSCAEVGVLGALPGIVGTYQAIEVLKIILKLKGVLSGKMMQINVLSHETNFININHREPQV